MLRHLQSLEILDASSKTICRTKQNAQHGVHADPSTGSGQRGWILTAKMAFSWLWVLSVSRASRVLPAAGLCPEGVYPLKGTMSRAVETVEKVTFQKYFLKSGRETLKNVWFLVFCTTVWQYFVLCLTNFEYFSVKFE